MAVVVTGAGWDYGPYCDIPCAATRNGQAVEAREATDDEVRDECCRSCGAALCGDDTSPDEA